MKNNLRKLMGIFVMGLFAFAFVPIVSAHPQNTENVIAGQTIESDFITEEETPSSTLGGLISKIEHIYREVVKMGLIDVWVDEQINGYQTFDILAFPSGSEVNFETIFVNDVFESSEIVEVRGTTASWETWNIESSVPFENSDYQIPVGIGEGRITFVDNSWIEITSLEGSTINYLTNLGEFSDATIACTDAFCPTDIMLQDAYGFVEITDKRTLENGYEGLPQYSYIFTAIADGNRIFLGNINLNPYDVEILIWDFSFYFNYGFMVSANAGNSLILLPTEPISSYDIYAVI